MRKRRPRCAVVGAANVDIGGFPVGRCVMHDSNPGRIAVSAGGVGRNIACNLARLGVETHLITALGRDAHGDMLRTDCDRFGVSLNDAFTFPDAATSVYLFIADEAGDMQLAVSDMEICGRLDPARLETRLDLLNGMDAVVLDANLPPEALTFLAEQVRVPILADAVSTAKASRLRGGLGRLKTLKPNAMEAETLTGIAVRDADGARQAASCLLKTGLRQVYITLGAHGVCCASGAETVLLPGVPSAIKNATGAGDAFTAALAWAELKGLSLRMGAIAGIAAASIAVESMETVNPQMEEAALVRRMESVERQLESLKDYMED